MHCGPELVPVFLKERQGASAAYRPRYFGRSELEHSAARKRDQPGPRIAGRSESFCNKWVRVVYSVRPVGNGWRCNACPNRYAGVSLLTVENVERALEQNARISNARFPRRA
jgi:hypothetical protein